MNTNQKTSVDDSRSANQLIEQIMTSSYESEYSAPKKAESTKKKILAISGRRIWRHDVGRWR